MAGVTLTGITKRFGTATAVSDLSLTIENGSFLALVGPSGCGKTTLLRLLAGFEVPDAGQIRIGNRQVADGPNALPPEKRRVGMVFQAYALWPHMSVADNVGYALRVRGMAKTERDRKVLTALETVGMQDYAGRSPAALSGGQRQRVALARCLAMEPALVLLDEPLANLDVHLRESMQEEFLSFHRRTGSTMVYVTHDQSEAMAMADQIAVMMGGKLRQVAAPDHLYDGPADANVADFVGRGMVVPGMVDHQDRLTVFGAPVDQITGPVPIGGGPVSVCLRMEDIALTEKTDGTGVIAATVTRCVYVGGGTEIHMRPHVRLQDGMDAPRLRLFTRTVPPAVDDIVHLRWVKGRIIAAAK